MPIDPLVLAMMSGGGGNNAIAMDPTYAAAIPRLQLAQQMMQEGTSAAPAYPMQALARVLQGVTGNYIFDKASKGLSQSAGQEADALSQAFPPNHPIQGMLKSSSPLVQYQGVQAAKAAMAQMGGLYADKGIGTGEGGAPTAVPGFGAAQGNVQSQTATAAAPGEATKAATISMATLPVEITKSLAANGLTMNQQGQIIAMPGYAGSNAAIAGAKAASEASAQNPALIQRAAGIASAELPYKVTEDAANYALRPVPLSPTERLQSGFNALPSQLQGAITNSVNQLPAVTGSQAPQGNVPFRLPQQGPMPPSGMSPQMQPAMPPTPAALPAQTPVQQPPSAASGSVPAAMTPAQFEAEQKLGQDFATNDKKAYDAANQSLGMLTGINNAIETLNNSGWSSTGTGMDARMSLAKGVNTISTMFGGEPVADPAKIASWEAFNKQTKLMGMQVINNYFGGSREAASIINGATTAVPNSENTYLGARLVSSGIEQDLQRQRELYQFKAQQVTAGKPLSTVETEFNQANPPQTYMHRAIANAIPDPIVNHLMQNPDTAAAFDKHFGPGVGEFILNGGRTQMGMAGLQNGG